MELTTNFSMIYLRLLSLIVLVTASACASSSVREVPSCTLVIRARANGRYEAQINRLEVDVTCRPDYGDTQVELHSQLHDGGHTVQLQGVTQVERSSERKCGALSEECLLSFCDSKGPITFEQPQIQGVRWPASRSSTTCAVGFGGASQAEIINGTFADNYIGSVLRVFGNSSVKVTETRIMDGTGGISAGNRSSLLLIDSTLASLHSDDHGACLYVSGNATVMLVNTLLHNCSSRRSGGAISAAGGAFINMTQNSSITGCSAEQGGGGLSLTDSAAMLARDSSFTYNTADGPTSQDLGRGGAAMLSIDASLTAVNCIWEGNQARMFGGVLTAETQKENVVKFINCTFRANVAGSRGVGVGGAIRVDRETQLVIRDSRFISNRAAAIAGVVAARGTSNVTLMNVAIYNNTSDSLGGALGVWDSAHMLVEDSRLWGNTADCWGGGAAAVFNTGVLNFSRSELWNNTGRGMGGAVSAWGLSQVYISACNLSGNVASRRGGAVRVADSATVVLRDSLLTGNQVGWLETCQKDTDPRAISCGGAIFIGDMSKGRPDFASRVELMNTTVAGNIAGRGGGLCAEPSAATSSAMPDQVKVKVLFGGNTIFTDNNGISGYAADVFALAAAVLSMPPGGSNLNTSSSTVFWEVSCDMGSLLDPTRGTCTMCAAPAYILDEGASRSTTKCKPCPEAAECFGGAVVVAKPKFYHTHGAPGARGEAGGTVPTCRLDTLTR